MKDALSQSWLKLALALSLNTGALVALASPAPAIGEADFDELLSAVKTLNKTGKATEAEAKLRAVLSDVRQSKDAGKSFDALTQLGYSLEKQGRNDEARTCFTDALAIAEDNKLGIGRLSLVLADLGKLYFDQAKYPESAQYFKRSVEYLRQNVSRNNPVLGSRLVQYSETLEKLGRTSEAADLKREGQTSISDFLSTLSRKARENWHPPRLHYSYNAVVNFEVANHGKVKDAKIDVSSHDDEADRYCVKAIEAASPLTNITWKDPYEQLFLDFNFDYNFSKERAQASDNPERCSTEEPTSIALSAADEIVNARKRIALLQAQLSDIKNGAVTVERQKLTEIYAELGEKLTLVGEQRKGISLLQEALASKDFEKKDAPERLILLSTLAHIKVHTINSTEAEPILKEVIESPGFENITDSSVKKRTLTDYWHTLCNLKRYAEAQMYFNRAANLH